MKIIRWLLCHLLLIIVLSSLLLGYVFRDKLKQDFNQLTGKSAQPVNKRLSSESQKAPVIVETTVEVTAEVPSVARSQIELVESTAGEANSNPSTGPDENQQNATPVLSEVEPVQDNFPPLESDSHFINNAEKQQEGTHQLPPMEKDRPDPWSQGFHENGQPVAPAQTGNEDSSGASSFPPDDYRPEEDSAVTEDIQAANTNSPANQQDQAVDAMLSNPESAVPPVALNETSDYQASLAEVRQMYWDGKQDPAQAAYEKLMFDYPEQPEAAAELGNILLQQGNRDAASWAYQNAIPRYLNLHREQEAITLLKYISQFDPAIANSLHKKYW